MLAIKGHFDGKVFVPEEPVDLPRGQSVTMYVAPTTSPAARECAPADQHPLDWIAENLIVDDPSLPTDGSEEHDHYLYGAAKRPPHE